MLKRDDGRNLYFTRETLSCMFDLTIVQAGQAMGVCHTTAKKIRAWSGLKRWPCCQVVCGTHPLHSVETVQRTRDAYMARAAAEGDACMYNVLFAASCIAFQNGEHRAAAVNARAQCRRTSNSRCRAMKRDRAKQARQSTLEARVVAAPDPPQVQGAVMEEDAASEPEPDSEQDLGELEDSLFEGLPFFDGLASPPHDRPGGSWLGGWQSSP